MRTTVAAFEAADIPLSLAEVKVSRRLGDDDSQDTVLNVWRQAALLRAERATRRLFIPRTVTWELDFCFPARFHLPWLPCGAVASISYIDANGVEQVLPADQYERVAGYGETLNEIVPAYDAIWPIPRWQRHAVKVVYTAGEAPDALILTAMQLIIGHWDEAREETQTVDLRRIPDGAAAILANYRI